MYSWISSPPPLPLKNVKHLIVLRDFIYKFPKIPQTQVFQNTLLTVHLINSSWRRHVNQYQRHFPPSVLTPQHLPFSAQLPPSPQQKHRLACAFQSDPNHSDSDRTCSLGCHRQADWWYHVRSDFKISAVFQIGNWIRSEPGRTRDMGRARISTLYSTKFEKAVTELDWADIRNGNQKRPVL